VVESYPSGNCGVGNGPKGEVVDSTTAGGFQFLVINSRGFDFPASSSCVTISIFPTPSDASSARPSHAEMDRKGRWSTRLQQVDFYFLLLCVTISIYTTPSDVSPARLSRADMGRKGRWSTRLQGVDFYFLLLTREGSISLHHHHVSQFQYTPPRVTLALRGCHTLIKAFMKGHHRRNFPSFGQGGCDGR